MSSFSNNQMESHDHHMVQLALITLSVAGRPFDCSAWPKPCANPMGDKVGLSNDVTHLARRFISVASRCGDAPAIVTNRALWTYTDIAAAVAVLAQRLSTECGVTAGDRVVVSLPNSPEYIAAFYGVLLAGGVVVPVSPKMESGMLEGIIESTSAAAVIATSQSTAARTELKSRQVVAINLGPSDMGADSWTGREAQPGQSSARQSAADELAAIFFTGGSTGSPKGVMLSHENLVSNALAIQQYLKIEASDRPLCLLPFHHAFGNSVWQSHLLAGATLVLDGQTTFPETIIEALKRHECTSLSGVPDLHRVLLERSSLGTEPLSKLRYMAVAGGALKRQLSLEVARRIAPAEFFVMYGQTEATARLAYLPPEMLEKLPDGCIGTAIPGTTLEIVDDENQPVAPGVTGELRAKGPGIMLGYWRDPVATAERIRSGWLYTGDLAAQDEAGWITVKGRRSSFVKIAGFRVDPNDIEDFATRRLAARQAVVVPFESSSLGTRLALFVRQQPGGEQLSSAEMKVRCRAELPRHAVPDLIEVVAEFPLNSALKIDRPRLTQMAELMSQSQRNCA